MVNRFSWLALSLLGALLLVSSAYADDPVSGAILDVDDTGFPDITVSVRVLDAGGRSITGLSPTAFSAEETGKAASTTKVETVLDQQIGVGVILTMDTSGSMYGSSIATAKTAASAFVRDLQPGDQTAILSFSSKVVVQDRLTPDRGTALAALGKLEAGGDTALFDAVADSIAVAQSAPLPRKAVLFLTDGGIGIEVSSTTRQQALELATQAHIPVYTIGLGNQIDRAFLEELSRSTGGVFLEAPTPASIPVLYSQLSQLLRSQYVVSLTSSAAPDVADRSLRLTITTPSGTTEVQLDYKSRRTIVPATPVPPAPLPPEPLEPQVVAPPSERNLTPLYFLLAVVALVGAVGLARTVLSRIQSRQLAQEFALQGSLAAERLRGGNRVEVVTSEAEINLVVDEQGEEQRFRVTQAPLTIGSAQDSDVRLKDDNSDVAALHARVWAKDGKLMYHHLAVGLSSRVAGSELTWGSLSDGDEVTIGSHKLRVEVKSGPD